MFRLPALSTELLPRGPLCPQLRTGREVCPWSEDTMLGIEIGAVPSVRVLSWCSEHLQSRVRGRGPSLSDPRGAHGSQHLSDLTPGPGSGPFPHGVCPMATRVSVSLAERRSSRWHPGLQRVRESHVHQPTWALTVPPRPLNSWAQGPLQGAHWAPACHSSRLACLGGFCWASAWPRPTKRTSHRPRPGQASRRPGGFHFPAHLSSPFFSFLLLSSSFFW